MYIMYICMYTSIIYHLIPIFLVNGWSLPTIHMTRTHLSQGQCTAGLAQWDGATEALRGLGQCQLGLKMSSSMYRTVMIILISVGNYNSLYAYNYNKLTVIQLYKYHVVTVITSVAIIFIYNDIYIANSTGWCQK